MSEVHRSIFDELDEIDPGADARRLAAAEADIAAGRLVPHEKVVEWLKTWGTPDYKPLERPWLK